MTTNGDLIGTAPPWLRAAGSVVRRLPFGRYRTAFKLVELYHRKFWTTFRGSKRPLWFICQLQDSVSRESFFNGRYEPLESLLVLEILQPGMTFVDVGANWGYFTLLAAQKVGASGKVISIEPDPRMFDRLEKNIARNNLDCVQTIRAAASNFQGVVSLNGFDETRGNFGLSTLGGGDSRNAHTFQVTTTRLDDTLVARGIEHVDLLKMDIEGAEGVAIDGLQNFLRKGAISRILLELHPHLLHQLGSSVSEVIGTLRGFGYDIHRIDHSEVVTRKACYGRIRDVRTAMQSLDDSNTLDDWPHVLAVKHGLPALN